MTKQWIIMGLLAVTVGTVQAESMRTVLTKENRMPRPWQAELGAEATYLDLKNDAGDVTSIAPYLRYGLGDKLAVVGTLPYLSVNPTFGKDEDGIGDARLGLEFLAYESLFGYPWVLPHVTVIFPSGDEDKGLGTGNTEVQFGVAIGTTVYDVLHYSLDVRYLMNDSEKNIPSAAVSLVWDLDRQFSLVAEMEISDSISGGSNPLTYLAGMHYKATRDLQFGLYGGTTQNTDVDTIIHGKIAYSF